MIYFLTMLCASGLSCAYLEFRRTVINANSAFTLVQLLLFGQCVSVVAI